MYAIFEAKGKQWRAEEGATLRLPSLDAEPGDRVTFERVLLAQRGGDEILVGRPSLRDASVSVEVVEHGRGDKIIVFKRKRRKNYRRKYGHRQPYTEVRIVEVDLEDATAPAPSEVTPEPSPEPADEPEAPEPGAEAVAEPEPEPEPEPEAAEAIDVTSAAEELAEEHGIDLAALEGTGKDGRILKSDVQQAVEEQAPEEEEEEEEAAGEAGAVVPDDVDITSAARELAEEQGLDVTGIEGTGKDGRILKSDVRDAIETQQEG